MRRSYDFRHPSTYSPDELMILGYAAAAEVVHLGVSLVVHGASLTDARNVIDSFLQGVELERSRRPTAAHLEKSK